MRAGYAGGRAQATALLATLAKEIARSPASVRGSGASRPAGAGTPSRSVAWIDPAWADEGDVVELARVLGKPHRVREVLAAFCPP